MSARCIFLRVINHTQLIYVAFQPSKPSSVIQKNVLALRSKPIVVKRGRWFRWSMPSRGLFGIEGGFAVSQGYGHC